MYGKEQHEWGVIIDEADPGLLGQDLEKPGAFTFGDSADWSYETSILEA